MGNSDYIYRWALSSEADDNSLLSEGLQHYGALWLREIHKHRLDLPLILASMKLVVPVLERHLDTDVEKPLYEELMAHSAAVDLTGLAGGADDGNE